jgi:hypothetical protein
MLYNGSIPSMFPHPIFGRITRAEWLRWGYLHADHHLRQFGRQGCRELMTVAMQRRTASGAAQRTAAGINPESTQVASFFDG